MRRSLKCVGALTATLLCLAALGGTSSSRAASITVDSPDAHLASRIYLDGPITRGDFERFVDAVLLAYSRGQIASAVFVNSKGGLVNEAVRIGSLVRQLNMTVSPPLEATGHRTCASACFFIWAGGVQRIAGAVGIHRPYFDRSMFARLSAADAEILYARLRKSARNYLIGMGVPDLLIAEVFATSSTKIRYLKADEMGRLEFAPFFEERAIARCGGTGVRQFERALVLLREEKKAGRKLSPSQNMQRQALMAGVMRMSNCMLHLQIGAARAFLEKPDECKSDAMARQLGGGVFGIGGCSMAQLLGRSSEQLNR